MQTLKFKLYNHKRNRHLKRTINVAGIIYNHCIALHKRYYRMFKKHLNCAKLQAHIAKLRNRKPLWQQVGSQAVQDICQEIEGKIKTVTIKRTPLGELLLVVVTDPVDEPAIKFETGRTAGFDFGLKTFLTCSEGFKIASPQFFKQSIHAIQKANRELSRKVKGSHNWEQARLNLCRKHEDIANRRRDWFWKLAHWLTNQFDVLHFETLNLKGMKRLWGRKIHDLGFREFLNILEWVAQKKGRQVVYRDQWFSSSKMCSACGHVLESLDLKVREWRCPECHTLHDRDENAAKNIKMGGSPSIGLGDVRLARPAISA